MAFVKNFFVQEGRVKNFLLDHEDPSDFALSCWQINKNTLPLLLWRIFLLISILTVVLFSFITYILDGIVDLWFIYLTHWGLLAILVMTAFSTGISARYYFKGFIDPTFGLPWYIKAYWVSYNISVPLAVMITIFYWTVLYDSGVEEELNVTLDVAVHGLNTLIVLLALFTNRHRSYLLHFYHPLLYTAVYVIFGAIYYAAGGTDHKGNPWIYPVIYWGKPSETLGMVTLTGLLLLFLHFVVVLISALRDSVSKRLFDTDDRIAVENNQSVPLRSVQSY